MIGSGIVAPGEIEQFFLRITGRDQRLGGCAKKNASNGILR
jgi:hypothetical protein